LLAACGSDTRAIDSFIKSMATEACAWEFNCCNDVEILAKDGRRFNDQAGCSDYRELELQNELYLQRAAAQQGRLHLDGNSAAACLDQLKARTTSCMPALPRYSQLPTPDACANAFVGSTPIGNTCEFGSECVPGSRCVVSASLGVCVPYQEEGEICNSSSDCDPAVPQLYCAGYDGRCHVRAKLGESCALTPDAVGQPRVGAECEDPNGDIYCHPTVGVCMRYLDSGASCSAMPPPGGASYQCNPNFGLTCYVGPGGTGTCATNFSCGVCPVDQFCDTTSTPMCVPKLDDGASCTADSSCKSNICTYYSNVKRLCYPAVRCNGR
jgi:hypothetical protein